MKPTELEGPPQDEGPRTEEPELSGHHDQEDSQPKTSTPIKATIKAVKTSEGKREFKLEAGSMEEFKEAIELISHQLKMKENEECPEKVLEAFKQEESFYQASNEAEKKKNGFKAALFLTPPKINPD